MTRHSSSLGNEETFTCPSCLTPDEEGRPFCKKCGSPVGPVATIDPLQTIQAEGFLFRRAIEGRPKAIVLVGIWILFLPMFGVDVYFAIHLVVNRKDFSDFFFFWAAVGLAYAGFVILYRTTKNFITLPDKRR